MCVYLDVKICVHVVMYTDSHIYKHMYTLCICVYLCMPGSIHVGMCICMSIHMSGYACLYMYAHMRMCLCAYKHVMDNSANFCAPHMQVKVWQPGSGIFQFSAP